MVSHLWQYLALVFSEWKCLRQKCGKNQNTRFIFNNFFRKLCHLWGNVKKLLWGQTGHKWHWFMALCMMAKQAYTRARACIRQFAWAPKIKHKHTSAHTHTHREICNTYCCFTVTSVSGMCLNITLYVYFLSCLLFLIIFKILCERYNVCNLWLLNFSVSSLHFYWPSFSFSSLNNVKCGVWILIRVVCGR